MSKNNYYLISRDRENNKMEFIEIPELISKGTKLELIDLFTMKFNSEAELIIYLYNNDLIDNFNVDLFIAHRGFQTIDYYEAIYKQDEKLISDLGKIAEASLSDIDLASKESSCLIDEFCRKMSHSKDFNNLVTCGLTRVYKKFIDYFKETGLSNHVFSFKFKEGGWAIKSYPLQRNMVEALIHYKRLKERDNDIIKLGINEANFNNPSRIKLKGKIKDKTDKNYFEGQLSLFEMNFGGESEEILTDKSIEVLEFIKSLPRNFIKVEDGVYSLNSCLFGNVDFRLVDYLRSMLSKRMKKLIYLYTLHNHLLKEANETFSNTMELEADLRSDTNDLLKLLRGNKKELDSAYSFIKLYNKCIMDEEMYKGESDGKCYRK